MKRNRILELLQLLALVLMLVYLGFEKKTAVTPVLAELQPLEEQVGYGPDACGGDE